MFSFFKKSPQQHTRTPSTLKKVKSAMMRLYDGAKTEHYWSSWGKSITTIDQAIHDDWEALVARSRDQYANNSVVKRYVDLCRVNIVGESVQVQSTVKDARGNSDLPVQRLIEREFANFSRKVTPCGLTRQEFESAVVQGCAIDGEVFIQPVISKKSRYGIEFRFIDPTLCPVFYHDQNKNIRHGIEYDENGAPVAYYFSDTPIKRNIFTQQFATHGDKLKRISADSIMHIFNSEWIGQKRGVPWSAVVLGQLRNIDGYVESAIINARVGATKMGFFETSGNGEYIGEDDGFGNQIMDAEPASFQVLPEGLKLSDWSPEYPHSQFGEFLSAHLRTIASGLGVANHSLTGDMTGVNYSSARIASLDERDMWKVKQQWLINKVTRPMFEMFLTYSIDMGKLKFNGNALREQPEHYFPASYLGRRWKWVDPAKEVAESEKSIALGLKSMTEIIREQGRDPETVWDEIAKEKEILDSLGVRVINDSLNEQNNGAEDDSND